MASVHPDPYSEEEPPPEDETAQCFWRQDPEENFSDWKIEVTSQGLHEEESAEGKAVDTYFVHRCILVTGSRSSQYFARLFGNRYKENKDCISRIELDPLAAKCFPYLHFSEA